MSIKIYASQDWVEEKLSDVTATVVPSAVGDALAQAKESGEFKGEPGQPGYTPQKDIDYFDGEPGAPGKDGGYYTPSVTTPNENTLKFAFEPSDNNMPAVESVEVPLPSATVSGNAGFVAQPTAPEDTSVMWIDTSDNDEPQIEIPENSGGIYVLDDGETIEDVPVDIDVAIDPNGIVDAFMPLTFTGAVNATYDGSKEVTVEIPQGGSGGESKKWVHIAQIDITEDTNQIYITEDVDENPFEVENIYAFIKAVKRTDELSAFRIMKLIYNENGTINENASLLSGPLIQQNSFGNKSNDKYYYYESVVVGNYRKLNVVESNGAFTNAMNAAAPSVYEDGTTISTIKKNATIDGVEVWATNGFKVGDTIDIWGI